MEPPVHHPGVFAKDLLSSPLKSLNVLHTLQAWQIWKRKQEKNLFVIDSSLTESFASLFIYLKVFFYFIDSRERGREEERGRETSISCLLYTTQLGLNLQPRHVP